MDRSGNPVRGRRHLSNLCYCFSKVAISWQQQGHRHGQQWDHGQHFERRLHADPVGHSPEQDQCPTSRTPAEPHGKAGRCPRAVRDEFLGHGDGDGIGRHVHEAAHEQPYWEQRTGVIERGQQTWRGKQYRRPDYMAAPHHIRKPATDETADYRTGLEDEEQVAPLLQGKSPVLDQQHEERGEGRHRRWSV